MKFIGIFIIFALWACSGGGVGGGGLSSPGDGLGNALDGKAPPDETTTQNTPLDEVAVGPVADYDLAVLMGHCSMEGASCPVTLHSDIEGNEAVEVVEDGCYQVKFQFKLTVGSAPLADNIIRIVETFKDIYKDFKTNSEGKAWVELTVGPNRVFEFYKAFPAPAYNASDPWQSCPDLNCIASTFIKIQTFLDDDCQSILYPGGSSTMKVFDGNILHVGPLISN